MPMNRMPLTAEKLQVVLQEGDEKACLTLFTGATERERQAVAELASRWLQEQWAGRVVQTGPGKFSLNRLLPAAQVAVLAACSLSQLKKHGWHAIPTDELAYPVLA